MAVEYKIEPKRISKVRSTDPFVENRSHKSIQIGTHIAPSRSHPADRTRHIAPSRSHPTHRTQHIAPDTQYAAQQNKDGK